jgi:hypothetical protein
MQLPHKQKSRRQHQADKDGLLIVEYSPTVRSNSFVISKNCMIMIFSLPCSRCFLPDFFLEVQQDGACLK